MPGERVRDGKISVGVATPQHYRRFVILGEYGLMPIRVSVDATKAIEGLSQLQSKDLPYALSRTLTASAKDAQAAVKAELPQKFTLRNRFFEGGIRIKPADKRTPSRIEADVHTYTANKTTGAPGFAERQEEGGDKVPYGGRQHIAIPTRYLRGMAPGAIPAELRPRALLGFAANQGQYKTRRGTMSNARLVRGFVFFLQTLKDGRLAIMGRHMHDEDAYPFYVLVPSASLKPRFNMAEIVRKTVTEAFPKNWKAAWDDILAKGLRVRF